MHKAENRKSRMASASHGLDKSAEEILGDVGPLLQHVLLQTLDVLEEWSSADSATQLIPCREKGMANA